MDHNIAVIITILTLGPILSWITFMVAREKERSTKSLKKFTAGCPRAYRLIFLIGAWFMIGIFTFVYFYNGLRFDDFDLDALLLGFVIAGIFMLLWLVTGLWKLRVIDDELIYVNFLGIKRKATFKQLDQVKISDQRSLFLYVNGKHFGTLNSDFRCVDNFLKRCEQEGIEIRPKAERPITKFGLYAKSMKPIFVICLVLVLILFAISIFMYLNQGTDITIFLVIAPFLCGLLIAIVSPLPLRGIVLISRQEVELGFQFNEDMRNKGVTDANYIDDIWFIDIDMTHILAFRRDYILKISGISKHEDAEMEAKVTGADGKISKVRASRTSLKRFRKWFYHSDTEERKQA